MLKNTNNPITEPDIRPPLNIFPAGVRSFIVVYSNSIEMIYPGKAVEIVTTQKKIIGATVANGTELIYLTEQGVLSCHSFTKKLYVKWTIGIPLQFRHSRVYDYTCTLGF